MNRVIADNLRDFPAPGLPYAACRSRDYVTRAETLSAACDNAPEGTICGITL